jgi:hypothetical protein
MKTHILIVLFCTLSVETLGQISILNGPQNTPDCNIYILTYDGTSEGLTPPYHPGWSSFPEGTGYSYFWYTSDGQSSCDVQPNFSFVESPVLVNLVLTPRKKPVEDHKVRISAVLSGNAIGNPIQNANPISCPFPSPINSEPWSDLPPKVGDTVYIAFPLERCNEISFTGTMSYVGLGAPFFLPFGGISITNSTPNSLDFNFAWPNSQQSAEIVVGFHVLASHNQPVECSLASSNDTNCIQNMAYNAIAFDGPYDPNILTPDLGIELDDCGIAGDSITYNLQFQNEGSGPTSKVYVFVKLDHNIDPASFRFVSANSSGNAVAANIYYGSTLVSLLSSAAIQTSYNATAPNVYCIEMNPLVLSSKVTNYESSLGYVTFKAKVSNSLNPGEQMITESEVVFDHNYAVQTNEAITSCGDETQCAESTFWCWVKCWHRWIISLLLLFLLLCLLSKLKGNRIFKK